MKINLKAIPLLILAMFALVSGVWGGLLRMGWSLPITKAELIIFHGPLMVCGFLGTVISLERAVAINRFWAYLSPSLAGIAMAGLYLGLPLIASQILIVAASLALLIVFIFLIKLERSLHASIMFIGVLCWIAGNFMWLINYPIYQLVIWWIAFLLFTITGERLELSRLRNSSPSNRNSLKLTGSNSGDSFIVITLISISGLFISFLNLDLAIRILGAGLIAFTAWLIKFDIARQTVKNTGLTRFIAVCLLSGYFWLAVSGFIGVYAGSSLIGTTLYDSFLHSFFLGFTFSMIFGHALIIIPAVLKIKMSYSPRFYAHLLFLHLSLLLRIIGGLFSIISLTKAGGLLNALVLLLFIVNTVSSVNQSSVLKKETN